MVPPDRRGPALGAVARRSIPARLAIGVGLALLVWGLLPSIPTDQALLLVFGPCSHRIDRVSLSFRSEQHGHDGGATLHHRRGTPARLVHRMKAYSGDYEVEVGARFRTQPSIGSVQDAAPRRTQTTRRVKLSGSTVTLHLEDLCPAAFPPPPTSPPAH